MPALVRIESLGPSFNTLAADDKYSRRNMQNFQQQLQTALSQTEKIFSAIFIAFIKLTLSSWVPNTVEISTTSLLSYCSMNMR